MTLKHAILLQLLTWAAIAAAASLPPDRIVISGDDPTLLPLLAPVKKPGVTVSSGTVSSVASGGTCYSVVPVPSGGSAYSMTVATPCTGGGTSR